MDTKKLLLRLAEEGDTEGFQNALRKYVLLRLGLPEDIFQTDLYQLCLMSLKLQLHGAGAVSGAALEDRLKKYDCHRTEAAVQKKVLLMMHLERMMEVKPASGGSIRTMEEFGKYLFSQLRGDVHDE